MWHKSLLDLIGRTPLVQLNSVARTVSPTVLAKVEYFNPGHSVKDRIALKMVEEAERMGLLRPGGTIVEATSGNTGMGLALVAAVKGYRCIFTVPDKQSKEKIDALRALGAEVVITPTNVPPEDPRSYYSVAKRLAQEIPGAFYPNQYDNLHNRQAHYETTGPEIWEQTEGRVTHFVAGMGTTGTICGIAQYLKERNPAIQVIGVDTYGSLFQKLHETGQIDPKEIYPYLTEGIGEDIVPGNLDLSLIDKIIKVTDRNGALMARKLARYEGLFVGWSSGSAVWGALQVAKELSPKDVVVVLLPDHGTRYLNKIYNDAWMRSQGFLESTSELTVRDVLQSKTRKTPGLAVIAPTDPLRRAVELMQRYEISQLPIIDGDRIYGMLTESRLIEVLMDDPLSRDQPVQRYMADPPVIVLPSTPVDIVSKMMTREMPAVLVQLEEGGWDIITRSDILHALVEATM
ncbi:MAG: pyridoxal-phosphate dependent enzyme [Bacteroidia bacterium]|nr:pyridoxal-phosphate dependent enzyme [Bacteroidia bacterium]MCX7652541.1 pyridoxal-phosphate dependent enzyme [Bacteroidia bacterium]MDW8417524.1 pyridoxal-phosphate dependent enzyme [Bacteroidia bacterium]